VRGDDGLPVVVRQLVDQVVADHTRAGDEDVEPAELFGRLRHRRLHLIALRDVAPDLERRAFVLEIQVRHGDLRALLREARGRRRPDPSRAAGDQRHLAVEPHAISTSASPVVTFSPASFSAQMSITARPSETSRTTPRHVSSSPGRHIAAKRTFTRRTCCGPAREAAYWPRKPMLSIPCAITP